MSEGWIKLHRKFTKWEWYDDNNTKTAFIHCLFRANYKDQSYRGKLIKRGQFITGIKKFGKECGLSFQQVRTAWSKLEATGEITTKSTNKGTTVTVCNYETYQQVPDEHQQSKQQSSQQSSNKRVTTIKNTKNIKKESVGTSDADFPKACTHLDEARSIAQFLLKAIISWDPSHKYNVNPPTKSAMNDWILEIERAMRLDGRTKEQLVYMVKYIFGKNTERANFWKPNIQSGEKLRSKFEIVKNQIKEETGARTTASPIDPDDITPQQLRKRGYMSREEAEEYCQDKFRDPLEECRSHFRIYRLNGSEYFKPAEQV